MPSKKNVGDSNASIGAAGIVACFITNASPDRDSRKSLSSLAKTRQWLLALDAFAVASTGQSITLPALIGSQRAPETGRWAA